MAVLTTDGHSYRDLNKNGRLDPYEDIRLPIEERVEDLLSQMTLAEKAGVMFHTFVTVNADGTLTDEPFFFNPFGISVLVTERLLNHFNLFEMPDAPKAARWHNNLQRLAEETRLGIPVTISSDPRHAFQHNPGAALVTEAFSQWPEPIGLAAIGDAGIVEQFADIARQEYLAVGIRVALHPMADIATEPRWGRISGTFGEDAELSAHLTAAYIRGFQGASIRPTSVACMTKHFPGGGPQLNGEDPHFSIGKEQVYPGNNFDYHLRPFEAAFEAGTAQIMPYYGVPTNTAFEEVGFGFNKGIITTLLREKYGFNGVVCTDWKLLTDVSMGEQVLVEAKCWGVEDLSVEERVKKILDAGADQLGGEACPEVIVNLVESGQIGEQRIDESVRRILRDKFRLGLFDNPFVDEAAATEIAGNTAFRAAGEEAQRRSIVLLKNGESANGMTLPLRGRPRLYVENLDVQTASVYGEVVESIDEADIAILRLVTPYEPREGILESLFHSGDLDFKGTEKEQLLHILSRIPTIVDIYLERPAVIPEIAEQSAALLGSFGANDTALLDIIFGRFVPTGKLPFELPSSMEAVRTQKEDVPYDSENPLFAFGHGLTYE
ncbi:MAG: glycoside hydrolase family 3 N-terminal domain-containing protein [Chloroflexota bacterium]